MPNLRLLAKAYGIEYASILDEISSLDIIGALAHKGPMIVEVFMDPMQPLIPRVQTTKNDDGSLRPGLLEDMYPYLPREEFAANMSISA